MNREDRVCSWASLSNSYAGHAEQGVLVARQCRPGAYMGRLVIVVDEGIDPSDTFPHAIMNPCPPYEWVDEFRAVSATSPELCAKLVEKDL